MPHPSRTIAVDIDDTLNDFSETLARRDFPYDPADSLPEETYARYLELIKAGDSEPSDLMSSGFNYCRFKIHRQCWQEARARPDAVEFMQWLRRNDWRIVICTRRDMRRGEEFTRAWLHENHIPFDYLFTAGNKVAFCMAWNIPHLIDDTEFNIVHGAPHNVNVYYPILPIHASLPHHGARGFRHFEEVRQWIQE